MAAEIPSEPASMFSVDVDEIQAAVVQGPGASDDIGTEGGDPGRRPAVVQPALLVVGIVTGTAGADRGFLTHEATKRGTEGGLAEDAAGIGSTVAAGAAG